MKLTAGLALALLSAGALNCGFYLQHSASGTLPTLALRRPLWSLSVLFTSWRWLAGFAAGLCGWAFYIAALAFAPLSLVQATSAGGVGLLALLVRLGGGTVARQDRAALVMSVAGLALIGLSLPGGAAHAIQQSWQAPLGWVLASALLAGVAAALSATLRPGAGLAAAAGLLYSAGDVATKAAVDGTSPVLLFAILLPVCHGLAFVSLQLAFQRGTALATAGVSTLLTNVLPILAGLAVFAEHPPAGAAGVVRLLGFAGAVLGATMLAAGGRTGSTHRDGERARPGPAAR